MLPVDCPELLAASDEENYSSTALLHVDISVPPIDCPELLAASDEENCTILELASSSYNQLMPPSQAYSKLPPDS